MDLDHVAHFVPDIAAAGDALERLGFTLTPFSPQSHRLKPGGPLVPAGTGNRCVMLERGYLEILTATDATPVADQLRAAMARYVGVHLIAFGTDTPDADHARLVREGFAPLPVVHLERPIGTETGEDTARFTVVRVPPSAMPEGRIQYCRQRTRHLVWQRRWTSHPNGLTGLAAVFVCADDAGAVAQRYGRYTGLTAERAGAAWRIRTERGVVMIAAPAAYEHAFGGPPPAAPGIAGYALESGDLATTRERLGVAGCTLLPLGDGALAAVLPPGLGGVLVVQAAGRGPPAIT